MFGTALLIVTLRVLSDDSKQVLDGRLAVTIARG
jgi:hypothetical protein